MHLQACWSCCLHIWRMERRKVRILFGSLPDYSLSHINDCHALSLSKLYKKMILVPIIQMRLNSDLESCIQSIQVLGMPLLSTTRKDENYPPLLQIFTNVCKYLQILMGRWRTSKIDSTHSSGVVSWLVTNFLLNLLEVFLLTIRFRFPRKSSIILAFDKTNYIILQKMTTVVVNDSLHLTHLK